MGWIDRIAAKGGDGPAPHGWLALIAALSIVVEGYLAIGFFSHGVQIPLIRYLSGDPAFQSDPVMHAYAETYTTVFYPAVAFASEYVPLPLLLFALFLACRAATVWLAYHLSRALWPDRLTGLLTALALALSTPMFAMEEISGTAMNHGALAQVLILGSLLLLARGRFVGGLALIGLTFNVHALHAVHALGIIPIAALLGRARPGVGTLAKGLTAALVLMAPTAYWMMQATAPLEGAPADYREAIQSWMPIHFFFSRWGPADWAALLFPVFAAWPLWKLSTPMRDHGLVARIALLSLLAGILGGILVEVIPDPLLIRAHPMRASWLMGLAGMPLLARAAISLLRAEPARSPAAARMAMLFGALLVVGFAVPAGFRYFFWLALLPPLWAFLLAQENGANIRRAGWAGLGLMAALSLSMIGLSLRFVEAYGAALAPQRLAALHLAVGLLAIFLALALAASIRVWPGYFSPPGASARKLFGSAMGLMAGAFVVLNMLATFHNQLAGPQFQWYDVQRWMAANLPTAARVIVPLSEPGVRAYSDQIPVFDVQEGNLMVHDPAYAADFQAKAAAFGWEGTRVYGLLGMNWRARRFERALTAEKVLDLARQFRATAAVRSAEDPPWPFPELYRNQGFVIYGLPADRGHASEGGATSGSGTPADG